MQNICSDCGHPLSEHFEQTTLSGDTILVCKVCADHVKTIGITPCSSPSPDSSTLSPNESKHRGRW